MDYKAILSGTVMVIFGLYLISLLIITILNKKVAVSYFSSFASSARAHYLEQILRLIVGMSMLAFSKSMLYGQFFEIFAWIIILSTIVLILIPWTWHNKLGKWVIPLTIRNLKFYAVSASIFGVFILYCVIKPMLE
jgi:hypothetical protein